MIHLRKFLGISLIFLGTLATAQAQYNGGSGTVRDPYQIATADDLIALGETPGDYDKHFVLTADIDLDPNLPGGRVFDRAVIAPDTDPTLIGDHGIQAYNGTPFTGTFDGAGHTISRLMVTGGSCLGLFGRLESGAEVRDLGVVGICLVGSGGRVGGLVGDMGGHVIQCYSAGTVKGDYAVGGLVGWNGGGITASYSTASVIGSSPVGGLVGFNGSMVSGMVGQTIVMSVDACYGTGTEDIWWIDEGKDYPRLWWEAQN